MPAGTSPARTSFCSAMTARVRIFSPISSKRFSCLHALREGFVAFGQPLQALVYGHAVSSILDLSSN
jgi:hypothetical protein